MTDHARIVPEMTAQQAAEYLRRAEEYQAFCKVPGPEVSNEEFCRAAFNMLLADAFVNEAAKLAAGAR